MDKDKLIEAFANYVASEGCSCCQDVKHHKIARKEMMELLGLNPEANIYDYKNRRDYVDNLCDICMENPIADGNNCLCKECDN